MNMKYLAGLRLAALGGFSLVFGGAQNAPLVAAPRPMKSDHAHGGAGHDVAGGHTHTTKLLFSSQPTRITAGKVAKWTLKVVDDIDNAPISDFKVVHDKLLHLIIVSKDMRWFNHLHPRHKGKGVFELEAILPRAGRYKLYADYHPKEREAEVAQHELTVAGPRPRGAQPGLVADRLRGGWMTKIVRSAIEGKPDTPTGPAYQVGLMPMPAGIEAGEDVMLHFRVRDARGKPVKLEPYLGAMGHLVLLSADSNTYLHTHPLDGSHNMAGMSHGALPKSGADVMFHTKFPRAGLYKAWGQFKHGGKIITAPFVLKVGGAATGK